jgi:trimethylamine--corrinoid protein Co-methyltransferase
MWTGSDRVLSDADAGRIHEASLQILDHTGVSIPDDGILDQLDRAGARVERTEKIAKIPPRLIEDLIPRAPTIIATYGRGDRKPFTIGEGITRSVSGFDATFIQDYGTVERRPITADEVGTFARLADRLPDIDIVGVQGIPQDVPQDRTEAHAVAMLLENTSKHILVAPDTGRSARVILKMVKTVTGADAIDERPVVSCHISPSAPLRWTPGACEVIREVVAEGVPFYILPAPIAGATSPVTLAGHLVQHNCQVLTGVVIAQVLREGHPVVYCNAHTIFNMREGNPLIATPETLLLRFAGAQMARRYGIPSHSIGFDTDAHIIDQQGIWEKALSAMACVSAGVDVMVNLGMYSTGLTVSYESLVIDHEIFSSLKRFQRGIDVTDEHLALDVIERIGTWGSYLEDEHTLRNFKGENWYPDISCRKLFERWIEDGASDMLTAAHEKAVTILAEPAHNYLDRGLRKELERIIASEQ